MTASDEFDSFYRAEYPRLAGALRLACGGDSRGGEELAQEAMVRAWTHWGRVRAMHRPAGWLYATGFNLVRRRGRERPRVTAAPETNDHSAATDTRLALERAVTSLPMEQRKDVVARHILGYTTIEAAELLRISPEALRSLLHRAVIMLRASSELARE